MNTGSFPVLVVLHLGGGIVIAVVQLLFVL